MAQSSVLFAAAKIKMKQSKAISSNDIARLIEADGFDSAKQVLVDIGFMPTTQDDYEIFADKYVSSACSYLEKYSPFPTLSNVLLFPYDAHNLKVLFKARLLGVEPNYLYNCGTVPLQKLKHAILNHHYGILPHAFKVCMLKLEKLSVTGIAPYVIDAMIDRACYALLMEQAQAFGNPNVIEYVEKKMVFTNIMMALRLQQMHKPQDMLVDLLLDSKRISKQRIISHYAALHQLQSQLHLVDKDFAEAFAKYNHGQYSLANVEKEADNSLLKIFKKVKFQSLHIDALMLYALTTQRQAAALRLVMAAKQSGASVEDIKERMRNIHA